MITTGLIIAILLTALYSRAMYPGFASSVAVVLSILLCSFRHPRVRWTNYQRFFVKYKYGKEARLERRATWNAKVTLFLTFGMIVGSLIVALVLGTNHDVGRIPSIPAVGIRKEYFENRDAKLDRVLQFNNGQMNNIFTHRPFICDMRVSQAASLNVLDVAALARGSYEASLDHAQKQIHVYNRTGLVGWKVYEGTLGRSESGVQWVEYRFDGKRGVDVNGDVDGDVEKMAAALNDGVSVVAVRGTSNLNDVFQDLYLWSTSGLLQMSTYMGTLVNAWPAETVDSLASFIMTFGPIDSTLVYWNEVENHVSKLLAQNRTVLMTGHSLGGAIAGIVASHKSIPAASFSAPGLGYSTLRYGLDLDTLQKYTMNVVPWHDAVPSFDLQVGLVQTIPCVEDEAQQYRFIATSDGYFNVVNQETGYCLDVSNSAVDNGSPVALFTCNGQDNQKWSVKPKGLYAGSIPAWIGNLQRIPQQESRQEWWFGLDECRSSLVGQYGIVSGSYQSYLQLPPGGGPDLPNTMNDLNSVTNYLRQLTQDGYLTPNSNTYYAIHFAPNTGFTCSGFCAEHSNVYIGDIANQSTDQLISGIMPDLNGCGCGGNSVFEAQTMSASYELIEAITDPAPWSGYVDTVTGAEIGDLCAYRTFSITGLSGNFYVIQKFWSKVANTCVE
ncbi:hypothetical protein HDU76_000431 [Blyttiomyces sp. JEL0837]|nr:hypothetical protein HDU76_000431 [Blyttiomyces sp. JEL0837]